MTRSLVHHRPAAAPPACPQRYAVILADPPWDYRNGGNGRARAHYPLMTLDQIRALPVGYLAAPHCVLLLWATWPQLAGACDCIRACSKPLLIARRGRPAPPALRQPAHGGPLHLLGLLGPRLEHSRKPADVYTLAESWPGPRIELFARRARQDWDTWGNEAPGSITWWPPLVHAGAPERKDSHCA